MTDRESFEAVISASPYLKNVARFPNLPMKFAWPGGYRDINVDLAWHMWQASRIQALEEAADVAESEATGDSRDAYYDQATRMCAAAIRDLGKQKGEQQ